MTKRKFYKTKITVTVISEEPLPVLSLEELVYEVRDGNSSSQTEQHEPEVLDGKQAVAELVEQGSDPCFFRLDDDGNDDEDEK